jgi:hypothetical protein
MTANLEGEEQMLIEEPARLSEVLSLRRGSGRPQ